MFQNGQIVWVRNFRDGEKWLKGVVVEVSGPLSYKVRVFDGRLWRRHVDHLRDCNVPPSETKECDSDQDSFLLDHPNQSEPQHNMETPLPTETENNTPQVASQESEHTRRYPSRNRHPPNRLYGTLNDNLVVIKGGGVLCILAIM